jgi:hypothetical protein
MEKTALLLLLCGAITAQADVTLPKVIDSKMVLQRDREVPVWGWADQGEEVTVEFSGQVKNNPLFPRLRSSHELPQRPSPQKQFLSNQPNWSLIGDITSG